MYRVSTQVNMMITVYATSGSRGEQAMTLAIDVVMLASSVIAIGLINFEIAEKILSFLRKDKEFLSIANIGVHLIFVIE